MIKLKDLIKDLELGKVYTDKDMPPFQTESANEAPQEAVDKIGIIKKQFPWAKSKMIDAIKMMIEMDADGLAGIQKNMKKNPAAFKQFVKDLSRMRGMGESVNEAKFSKDQIEIIRMNTKNFSHLPKLRNIEQN